MKFQKGHKNIPWNKGKKGLQVAWNKGKKCSNNEISRLKNIGFKKGYVPWNKNGIMPFRGEKHYAWKVDRTQLMKKNDRNDMAYKDWRKQVWTRDNFICKINNENCNGRIEAHHILSWNEYPELRYQINNGITLCHAHHPKKRAEEKRLIPTFMELMSVSKV